MRVTLRLRALLGLFALATVIYAIRNRRPQGRFLKVPYDFRFPTPRRVLARMWNPEDPRLVTPHPFGIGWTVNLYQCWRRLRALSEARRGGGRIKP